MQMFKRGIVAAASLFSPMTLIQNLNSQLTAWSSRRLVGFSDGVVVTIRMSPNLLPSYERPTLSVSGNVRLQDNVNVLARCTNEKRYLQVNMQAMGSYVVVATSVTRGSTLAPASITPKRDRLDQLPPHAMLDTSQVQNAVNLCDLVPGQPVQLSMLRQAWWIRTDQRALIITSGGGFRVNAESKAPNNAAVARNARVRVISDRVVNGIVDPDENIFINLQQVKDFLACADR